MFLFDNSSLKMTYGPKTVIRVFTIFFLPTPKITT